MLSRTGEIADRKGLPVNIDKPTFGEDEDAHRGSLSDGGPGKRDHQRFLHMEDRGANPSGRRAVHAGRYGVES